MIRLFEEYVEFRKTGDVFNFADYVITKQNYEAFTLALNDFLVVGEWYRIIFTPQKSIVIRLTGLHSGVITPEIRRYFYNNFTLTWDKEYFKGKVTTHHVYLSSMMGNGHVWFSLKNNDTKSMFRDDLLKTKNDERIYYYNWENNKNTIIERIKKPDGIKNLDVDPLGEEDWDDLTESKKRKTVCRGKLTKPDIDPLGEEDWSNESRNHKILNDKLLDKLYDRAVTKLKIMHESLTEEHIIEIINIYLFNNYGIDASHMKYFFRYVRHYVHNKIHKRKEKNNPKQDV